MNASSLPTAEDDPVSLSSDSQGPTLNVCASITVIICQCLGLLATLAWPMVTNDAARRLSA